MFCLNGLSCKRLLNVTGKSNTTLKGHSNESDHFLDIRREKVHHVLFDDISLL